MGKQAEHVRREEVENDFDVEYIINYGISMIDSFTEGLRSSRNIEGSSKAVRELCEKVPKLVDTIQDTRQARQYRQSLREALQKFDEAHLDACMDYEAEKREQQRIGRQEDGISMSLFLMSLA